MARNEEKALTLWNKWHTFKHNFHSDAQNRKPLSATECQSLPDAEKWRRDIVKDLKKKVSLVQNASLGEHRIRELNDEINKHMRQKHYWEIRIRELGGGDFRGSRGTQYYEIEGKELPGASGYKYYGAAKELPGVRELFAEHEDTMQQRRKQRSRADIYKNITPDYYGYRDDDDGVLAPKESVREKRLLEDSIADFAALKKRSIDDIQRSGGLFGQDVLSELKKCEAGSESEEEELCFMHQVLVASEGARSFDAGPSPDMAAIQLNLMSDKKRRLLDELL